MKIIPPLAAPAIELLATPAQVVQMVNLAVLFGAGLIGAEAVAAYRKDHPQFDQPVLVYVASQGYWFATGTPLSSAVRLITVFNKAMCDDEIVGGGGS